MSIDRHSLKSPAPGSSDVRMDQTGAGDGGGAKAATADVGTDKGAVGESSTGESGTGESGTRAKILMAAGPMFAEQGFANTKVRQICDSAGVNVASVNYYFGDKKSLYIETVRYARETRAAETPFALVESDRESELRNFIETLVRRTAGIDDPPWEVQLILREVLFPTDACRHLVDEYFRPFFQRLIDVVKKFAPGPIREEVGYRLGYSIIGQVMYLRFTSRMKSIFLPHGMAQEHFQISQIADHVYNFSVAALRSPELWQDPEALENNQSMYNEK